jgi:hypothetical protein
MGAFERSVGFKSRAVRSSLLTAKIGTGGDQRS